MKAAFFHDAPIYSDGQKMYSTGFPYELWERYLGVFEALVVCTRKRQEKNQKAKYKVSSGPRVSFKLNEAYQGPIQLITAHSKITKPIREVVAEIDCAIIRLPSVIGLLAVKECIRQNKPWAVEVVACPWDSYWNYGNIKGKIFAPYMYTMTRKYIKKAPYAIYVSKKFLPERYPCMGYTAYATDTVMSYVAEDVLLKRQNNNALLNKEKAITLGLIGSLAVGFKGHKTALEAVKILKTKGYKVTLKCLGGGSSSKWESLAQSLGVGENVKFEGVLPGGEAVFKWLDELDIFIMPSLQEGLPRSMVEAMSRGCPIVGTRVGGIPELIEESCIVRPKDAKDLATKIEALITNTEFAKSQSERNFKEARKYVKEETDPIRDAFWQAVRKSCMKE